jgi:hypothetical protein
MDSTSQTIRTATTAQQDEQRQTHVFVVRVWRVQRDGHPEYRGSIRDVLSGAQRHFADWSVAEQFVMEQVDEHERDTLTQTDGGVA